MESKIREAKEFLLQLEKKNPVEEAQRFLYIQEFLEKRKSE